jgi:hypothetical protein
MQNFWVKFIIGHMHMLKYDFLFTQTEFEQDSP